MGRFCVKRAFVPLGCIQMTDGRAYDIQQPEMMIVSRSDGWLGVDRTRLAGVIGSHIVAWFMSSGLMGSGLLRPKRRPALERDAEKDRWVELTLDGGLNGSYSRYYAVYGRIGFAVLQERGGAGLERVGGCWGWWIGRWWRMSRSST